MMMVRQRHSSCTESSLHRISDGGASDSSVSWGEESIEISSLTKSCWGAGCRPGPTSIAEVLSHTQSRFHSRLVGPQGLTSDRANRVLSILLEGVADARGI